MLSSVISVAELVLAWRRCCVFVLVLGGIGVDGMFGRKTDLMLAELAWRRHCVLVLGSISAGGFGGDRMFGRSADLMLVELAWQWSRISVLDGIGAG